MRGSVAGTLLLLAIGQTTAGGQQAASGGRIDESLAGSLSFDLHCASCHGPTGRGDGPAGKALRTTPADLTVLARRNNGVFPSQRVSATLVDSSRLSAHGTRDMPIWGPLFRTLDGTNERESARLRNLLAFLASIQLPRGDVTAMPGPDPGGDSLYRDFCSSCHGPSARGGGPFTFALRKPAPNLRTLTIRNGGVFPREAAARVIAGIGVPSHGSRDMPLYGELFRRLRPRDPGADTRIEALVAYLERIQDRPTP